MSNPLVIDLSHWNPEPDWPTLKKAGTVGVILKATEGTSYVDETYGKRQTKAREAGLLTASYHFMRPGKITEQMRWYLDRVQPAPGDRLILDFEDPKSTATELEAAISYLSENTACMVAVYGSNVLVDATNGRTSPIISSTSLWQARYSSTPPQVPSPWQRWDLWQYTDKAAVSGVSAPVDANKWNSESGKLQDWFSAPDVVEPPDVDDRRIDVEIAVPDGYELYVNGTRVESA